MLLRRCRLRLMHTKAHINAFQEATKTISKREPNTGDTAIDLAKWHQMNDRALKSMAQNQMKKSKEFFQIAVEMRKDLKDVCFATSLTNFASLKRIENEPQQSADMLEEALFALDSLDQEDTSVLSVIANAKMALGFAELDLERPEPAYKNFKDSYQLIERLEGSTAIRARCTFGLAKAAHLLNKLDEAEEFYELTLDYNREIHKKTNWNVAEILRSLGALHANLGNVEQATERYFECMDMLVEMKSVELPLVISEYMDFRFKTIPEDDKDTRALYEGAQTMLQSNYEESLLRIEQFRQSKLQKKSK